MSVQLQHQSFELFADYCQFYLWDRGMNPLPPVDYTTEDVKRRLKTGSNVVVVLPERNMTVAVEVEIHDSEPAYNADEWDHIAECSLELPTGQLEVHECTGGPVVEFIVKPGWYRVRSFHGGFNTISENRLDGDDYYRVVLWLAPPNELRVVKQWV
jgi:hypothetical protein